jgi:hypothetical protein
MGESSRIIRKFERMMGRSYEEQMERVRNPRPIQSDSPGEIIGKFTYNFETGKEKFTPTLNYRIRSSFNQLYSHIYSYFHPKKNIPK